MRNFDKLHKGGRISASDYNRATDALQQLNKCTVEYPLEVVPNATGWHLRMVQSFSGDANSYHQKDDTTLGPCWYAGGQFINVQMSPGLLTSTGNFMFSTGKIAATPYWSGEGGAIDKAGILLTTPAAASGRVRLAIYSASAPKIGQLYPDALLWDSGAFASDNWATTGPIKFTLSPTLSFLPNSLYWLCFQWATAAPQSSPAVSSCVATSGGTIPDGTTIYYGVTAVVPSGGHNAETVLAIGGIGSDTTSTGFNSITTSWGSVTSASSYRIYTSSTGILGSFVYLDTTASLSYTDTTGVNPTVSPPYTLTNHLYPPPAQTPEIGMLATDDYYQTFGVDDNFAWDSANDLISVNSRVGIFATQAWGAFPSTFPSAGATAFGDNVPAMFVHYSGPLQ